MTRRNRKLCVAIAKDVIAQLRLERFRAKTGQYIGVILDNSVYNEDYHEALKESFQKHFKENKGTTCEVCALGAAFVSMVNIENKCSIDEVICQHNMFDRLEKHFGADNIALMESAFEGSCMDNSPNGTNLSIDMLDVAGKWGNKYKDNDKRLRAIMLNVIRNNGDFKLPKKYIAKAKKLEKEYA